MLNRRLFVFLVLLVGLVSGGCATGAGNLAEVAAEAEVPATTAEPAMPVVIRPAEETILTQPPEEVALAFFSAYRDALEKMEPALEDPQFEARSLVSEEYLKQVAEIKAGFDGTGFDPVLHVQMVPPGPVEVKDALVEGDRATVTLQFGRGVMETPWEREVSLERIEGEWKIVPDFVEGGAASPEEAVLAFYQWYLDYATGSGAFRSPLAGQAYRAAPYLGWEMIARVDRLVEAGELAADPFVCAQDLPAEFEVESSFYNDAHPVVVIKTDFPGHFITADLVRAGFNHWTIQNISCGRTAVGVTKAFYAWALDTITGSGELRNPWVEGAYRESDLLSQGFIQGLDEQVNSKEGMGADPVLLAQNIPASFSVVPCGDEPYCARVNLQFGEMTATQIEVRLVEEGGLLKIDHLERLNRVETSGLRGPVYLDETYGFAFQVPEDWQVRGLKVTDSHTPEEYPLMRSLFTGPQAPGVGDAVYSVEVWVADEATMAGNYPEEYRVGEIMVNGQAAQEYRIDPGIVYTVFQHPVLEKVWVVFSDPITQFPGRETQAEITREGFEGIIQSLTFSD